MVGIKGRSGPRTTTPFADFNRLANELKPYIGRRGRFPTRKEFAKWNRPDLEYAIKKYHGGSIEVAKRLAQPIKSSAPPKSIFADEKNAIRALEYVKRKTKRTPTTGAISAILGVGASDAIMQYHGLSKLLKKIGMERQVRPIAKKGLADFPKIVRGSAIWKDSDYAALRYFEFRQKYNHWLSAQELHERKMRWFVNGVTKYHGDFEAFSDEAKKLAGIFERLAPNDILAIKAKAGNLDARNALIKTNVRTVNSIANMLYAREFADDGVLGLIAASGRYDFRRGHFRDYASAWIKSFIRSAFNSGKMTIALPKHIRIQSRKLSDATIELTGRLGRPPSNEELAAAMKTSVSKINELQRLHSKGISLDAGSDRQGGKSRPLIESKLVLKDYDEFGQPTLDSVRHLIAERKTRRLESAFKKLSLQERKILALKFNLNIGIGKRFAPKQRTIEEISILTGKGRNSIQNATKRAIAKLREYLTERKSGV